MKKKLIVLSGFVFSLAPVLALAQVGGVVTTGSATACGVVGGAEGELFGIICQVGRLLNSVVPVLIALGVVYFIWGVVTYMIAGDEEKKAKGRTMIIYGVIGLAVIVAVWGLVTLLTKTFGVDSARSITLPTIPTSIDN